MSDKPKILLVGNRWGHMGGHSGLIPLGRALETYYHVTPAIPNLVDKAGSLTARLMKQAKSMLGKPVKKQWSPFHHNPSALIERAAIRMAKHDAYAGIIFEAVEDTYCRFGDNVDRSARNTPVIGISHQPPAWWKLFVTNFEVPSRLHAVFALSQEASTYLSHNLDCKVDFIRHGVQSDYFCPPTMKRSNPESEVHLLFCGQWLRNFEMLERLLIEADAVGLRYIAHMVVPLQSRNDQVHLRLARRQNTIWHSGLTDDQLKSLYQRCHFLMLPLIDATANNSLLEAMSCELPIFVSQVGGVSDYVDAEMAEWIDPDPKISIARLMRSVRNYDEAVSKARLAGNRAREELQWGQVALTIHNLIQGGERHHG